MVIFKETTGWRPIEEHRAVDPADDWRKAGRHHLSRHQDVRQTKKRTWFFDMVDEPKDQYPRTLKGGSEDERMTPLHPLLVERGVLQMVEADKPGYVCEQEQRKLECLVQAFAAEDTSL